MPKIPTLGIGNKISTSVPVASVPIGALNQDNEAFAGFTNVVNNVMAKTGEILTNVEATDYYHNSMKDYDYEYDKQTETLQKQLTDSGRVDSGLTYEEAMAEWSTNKINELTEYAPTQKAYSVVKDGMSAYDRKTNATARATQFDHVYKRQIEKIEVLDKAELGNSIEDYVFGNSEELINYTKSQLSKYSVKLDDKRGDILNPTQVEQYKFKYGHESAINALRTLDRSEKYDGIGKIFGRDDLMSERAQKIIAEEMGLTVGELRKTLERVKTRGPQSQFNLKDMEVAGLVNNVTSTGKLAKPDELAKYLTPEEKDHYLRVMIKGLKDQKQTRDGFLAERIKQAMNTWNEGKGTPSTDAEAKNIIGQIAVTDTMEDWQKTKTIGELIAARYMDKSIKKMPLASPMEARAAIQAIPSQTREFMRLAEEVMENSGVDIKNHYAYLTTASQDLLNTIQSQLTNQFFKSMEMMGRDGSQYFIDNHQGANRKWQEFNSARVSGNYEKASTLFKEFTSIVDREQNRRGQPHTLKRFVPKTFSADFKAQLDNLLTVGKDPNKVEAFIATYEAAFGDKATRIFDEIERNKDIDESVNYARSMPLGKRGVLIKDAISSLDIKEMSELSKTFTLKESNDKLLTNEEFSNFRKVLISSGFPNNVELINKAQVALGRRIFLQSIAQGDKKIKAETVSSVMDTYFSSVMYSREGGNYSIAIPMLHLQRIKPDVTEAEISVASNAAKDSLISDKYDYEMSKENFEAVKNLMTEEKDFSQMKHETHEKDPRIQKRFREFLIKRARAVAVDSRGFVLQIDGQTISRKKDGVSADVILPLEDALNDPRVKDELAKKLAPKDWQKMFDMRRP